MKKFCLLLLLTAGFLIVTNLPGRIFTSSKEAQQGNIVVAQFFSSKNSGSPSEDSNYRFPEFYRGIYLTVSSANNITRLKELVAKAKSAGMNTMVLDVQSAKFVKCMVPAVNVQYCKDNGIHPIARIVVFPDGLRHYPASDSHIEDRITIAEDACKNGFKEIQFDYIRFNDSGSTRHLTYAERYKYIEDFILKARARIKKYNVLIAADVFGRIPLNRDDIIGQKMESLDKVADIICPMAYPSHYTWSKKFYTDPYYTVHETSVRAKERSKNAMIVTYIQAFKMKMSGIPYEKYVLDQVKAAHDAGIKGYIMWNARQDYELPLAVAKSYYQNRVSRKEKPDSSILD